MDVEEKIETNGETGKRGKGIGACVGMNKGRETPYGVRCAKLLTLHCNTELDVIECEWIRTARISNGR